MAPLAAKASERSVAELTKAVIGRSLSMPDLAELVDLDGLGSVSHRSTRNSETLWVGSIGYERYNDVHDFARCLVEAGVERLIDVRELPISRRRGYAKSSLTATLAEYGIEYVHVRALGNPKPLRDLYKSGRVTEGRREYSRFLTSERSEALSGLPRLLREKRSALMCVEHDESICHRQVILSALKDHLGIELDVAQLGER